jgi:hypothetical protein
VNATEETSVLNLTINFQFILALLLRLKDSMSGQLDKPY